MRSWWYGCKSRMVVAHALMAAITQDRNAPAAFHLSALISSPPSSLLSMYAHNARAPIPQPPHTAGTSYKGTYHIVFMLMHWS